MPVKNIKKYQNFHDDHLNKEMVFKEEKSQAFVLNFLPGQSLPSHGHPHAQVYLLVLEGTGTCSIDEETFEIQKNDAIHCSKEEQLSIENTGTDQMSVYVVLAREGSAHQSKN